MKIKYGISNCHYAVATEGAGGALTYGIPKEMPGAVALTLEANGEEIREYADNIEWFIMALNSGYTGSLEVEVLGDDFRTDVLGEEKDRNDVYFENALTQSNEFALLFQFELGDAAPAVGVRGAMLRCKAGRPGIAGNTRSNTINPDHETVPLTCLPRANDHLVKAKADSTSAAYANWFTAVVEKAS